MDMRTRHATATCQASVARHCHQKSAGTPQDLSRLAIDIKGIEAFESKELRSCVKQIKGKIQLLTASTRQHIRFVVPNDLRVEFLLKTDSGYPRDAEVTLFTLANPEHSLRFNTHWSAPPVSTLARSEGFVCLQ